MALTADILRGYTDNIILRQLAAGDSYGYQINKQVAQITDGIFEMKEATLYTAFRRLEGAGLIRAYWGDEQSGARRRYYALTESGRERSWSRTAWHGRKPDGCWTGCWNHDPYRIVSE